MSDSSAVSAPISYEEVTDDAYGVVGADFRIEPVREGVLLTGPCPRCGHTTSWLHLNAAFRGAQSHPPDPRLDEQLLRMLCRCHGMHPGRPMEEIGCGAYWNILLIREGS
jgi:hypothetical protein